MARFRGAHSLQFLRSKRLERFGRAATGRAGGPGRRLHLARKREAAPSSNGGRKPPAEKEPAARPIPEEPPTPSLAEEPPVTLARLRHYRKLTRAVGEHLRQQLSAIVETLTPLFHAETVFGDYVQRSVLTEKTEREEIGTRGQLGPDRWGRGSELSVKRQAAAPPTARELEEARKYAKSVPLKEAVKGADSAFRELERLYESVARKRPYDIGIGLKPPLPINTSALEIFPVDYPYVVTAGRSSKRVMVTAPLTWLVAYAGFSPARLRALIADPNRSREDLQRVLTHHLLLHVVLDRKPGLKELFEALHFPVKTEILPEFGELPLTLISSAVKTERPADEVILESIEISGVAQFEEVVRVTGVATMPDARRERLLEVVRREESEDAGTEGG
jgi:hypothetical protein